MDSDSSGGERSRKRRKRCCDNDDNAKESVEEVPKILSPEIHDVFHVFASMLDIKSFMNLARTSKDMYKRCMDNKTIRISVDEDSYHDHNNLLMSFHPKSVSWSGRESYIAALRKLPCNVGLRDVNITFEVNADYHNEARKNLKEIRVNRIQELHIDIGDDFVDSEAIVSFIKAFDVVSVYILEPPLNDALLHILRSILQLSLKKLCCDDAIPIDFILEIESSIPEMSFPHIRNISKGQLAKILSNIHSGSLRRLTLHFDAVNWDNYDKLPFDHEGPLTEDHALLFARNDSKIDEYWFLHWHGGVTKCVRDNHEKFTLEIFSCEPWELPCALRKNEDILSALAEKRPRVCCSSEQFNNFTAGFTMIDHSHEGSLPDDRPLYCKVDVYHFWLLDENENLMKCSWEVGSATWESLNLDELKVIDIDHPALSKYVFWKVLKQVEKRTNLNYFCKELSEFNSWLEDCEKVDFEYTGALPSARPLVFQRVSSERENMHVVLLEDRLVQCEFNIDTVKIKHCHYSNCPPILFVIVEMLKYPDRKSMNFNISFDVFREGLGLLKKSILVLQKLLIIAEKTETEFWYRNDNDGVVWKVEWKEGRISNSQGRDLSESPPIFLKQVFRSLVEERSSSSFALELELFRDCLEQFSVVPFEYSGPLTSDSPMAFVINEIRHTCCQTATCRCSEVSAVHVWFLLEDGLRLRKCSWERNGPKKVQFGPPTYDSTEVPAMLQSKEYLQKLLQAKYDDYPHFVWLGLTDDFFAYMKDYKKLSFKFDGRLPMRRPLLFENSLGDNDIAYYFLREDGTIIHCKLRGSYVTLSSSTEFYKFPPALMSIR